MTDIPAISVHSVEKYYGNFHALKSFNLTLAKGEKVVVCGPSGSGKSTVIRTINQLEEHQSGEIRIDGQLISSDAANIDAMRREVGMVFQ